MVVKVQGVDEDMLFRVSCLESCYWHLVEKRFCFDKSIALYEEPAKKNDEKNNNMFENMAFFDSVSVIAGRSIVTIEPLPEKPGLPVVQQPHKRLKWYQTPPDSGDFSRSFPTIFADKTSDHSSQEEVESSGSKDDLVDTKNFLHVSEPTPIKKSVSFHTFSDSIKESDSPDSQNGGSEPDVKIRKKSLRERRLSKSLYLKIDLPKELPIIRQNSMPKFYLDTPESNQTDSSLFRHAESVLKSPMTPGRGFDFDLKSVVQMEKSKSQTAIKDHAPIHRESSRLNMIKEKMKLKKSKSTVSSSNVPYSNYI